MFPVIEYILMYAIYCNVQYIIHILAIYAYLCIRYMRDSICVGAWFHIRCFIRYNMVQGKHPSSTTFFPLINKDSRVAL